MAKRNRKQEAVENEQTLENTAENVEQSTQQRVRSDENFANVDESPSEPETKEIEVAENLDKVEEQVEEVAAAASPKEEQKKGGGTAIALLALLIALGVGGAGYFFGQQKFADIEARLADAQQKVQALAQNGVAASAPQTLAQMPSFEAEKAQIAKLEGEYQKSLDQIRQLEQRQGNYTQQINSLQAQLQKLGAAPKAEPTAFLLSDADFLLTNALRKVAIDNDIETAKSLLIEADGVLNQVSDPQALAIREAIKADFDALNSLNKVDQNNVMQRLAQLANLVDDMPMLDNEQLAQEKSGEVSDNLADWQQNIEKSANSFLSHFVRISEKGKVQEKAFIAPNQEIYLRENIRLRLQIALLAVPRQQNELYKQSLEAISTWVRSYFDVQNGTVKNFLKETDDLIEQSIYIDAPAQLQSLNLLKQKLNRTAEKVEKIELEVDKAVEQMSQESKAAEQPAEQPAQPNAQ